MKSQLKIGVVLSYISMGLNMAIQLLFTPVMVRLLGQSEYGLYTLVGGVVSYLSLFSLGFTGAYLRFYSRYKKIGDNEATARLNGMFLSLFICMSGIAIICGFILSQFTPQIFGTKLTPEELGKAKILMQILVVNIALTFPMSIFDSIVSAHEQFVFQRVLSIAGIVCNPLIALPLLLLGYGSVAMVVVTTLITVAKLCAGVWFCFARLKIPVSFHHFDFSLMREMAGFSFFIFLNMIIDQVNWSVDKFILGRVSGTVAVAIYGVGAQINEAYTLFSSAVSSVFAPRINRIAASSSKEKPQEYTALFIKTGRIQFIILALIATGFIFFGKYFITDIYTTKQYEAAYYVVLLLILPATIPLIQNVGLEIQRAENKHQFRSIVYFFMAIVNVVISVPLAAKYGPVGSAAGTALSLVAANGFIMNIFYYKVMKIDIIGFWQNILSMCRGLILPVILGVLIFNFVDLSSIAEFAFWVVVYTLVYAICMWCFGMNEAEKVLFSSPIKRLLKRQ